MAAHRNEPLTESVTPLGRLRNRRQARYPAHLDPPLPAFPFNPKSMHVYIGSLEMQIFKPKTGQPSGAIRCWAPNLSATTTKANSPHCNKLLHLRLTHEAACFSQGPKLNPTALSRKWREATNKPALPGPKSLISEQTMQISAIPQGSRSACANSANPSVQPN